MVVCLDGLPPEAATWGYDGWTVQHELAAETVELLDAVRIQVAALTGDKSVKRWKAVQIPRPESVRPKKNRWVEWAKGVAQTMRR